MKYLISITLLFALCGCETIYAKSKDQAETVASPTVATPDQVSASKTLKGKVGRAGLYRLVRSGGVINDPSTSTGKSVSKPVVEMIKTAQRIPLIKGAQMYLQYRIWPLPARPAYADFRRVLKHPPMTLPNGKVSTGSDFMIKVRNSANQAIGYTGYGLDEDYELVEGDWIFEIWYKDRKMIEQKFTTYWPDKKEIAKLEPLLALGNRAMGQNKSTGKSYSRQDWPRIAVGIPKSSD